MADAVVSRRRERLSWAEWAAGAMVVGGLFGFGAWGFSQHEPSTVAYLFSVTGFGCGVAAYRREQLPAWLAMALALLALGHLAGGLVMVGGDVLYNAHPQLHAFQYDHVFHAAASGIASIVLWRLLSPQLDSRAGVIVVSILGGLGVGAINELIEFLATLAHHGRHVGGYRNTGMDLVSNTVGAVSMTVAFAVDSARVRRA